MKFIKSLTPNLFSTNPNGMLAKYLAMTEFFKRHYFRKYFSFGNYLLEAFLN